LEDILRKEWNFNGVVVSDGGAGAALVQHHHYVDDHVSALAVETKNGVDVINDWEYCAKEAYDKGLLTDETLNKIIRRQLDAKMRLGFFDQEREEVPYSVIECKEHQSLALECAEKSIVLLKNKDNILPLNKEKINTIAVIGPNADCREVLLGNYHGTPSKAVTFLTLNSVIKNHLHYL
jgi:beta-glucosidase